MDLAKMKGLMQGIKDIREENSENGITLAEAESLNHQGVEEYKNQNYGKAFVLFLKAAENGDAWGMYNVGTAYRDGEGTSQNMDEAFHWIKKAAQNGIVDAMFDVGKMYYRGEGTEKDAVQSFAWCKKAAEEGHVWSMNWVGEFYNDGEGVMQNYDESWNWHLKAAEQGNANSMYSIGMMLACGEGVEQDLPEAVSWLEMSLSAGREDLDTMYIIGKICDTYSDSLRFDENGNIRDFDDYKDESMKYYRMTKEYWTKAANAGHEEAQKALAEFNSRGDLCFITTAVCDSFGKPDNCYELTSFRKFRDGWLSWQTDGRALIAEYYEIAPRIVRHINSCDNAKEIYRSIWDNYLQPCLTYIEQGSFAKCKETYIDMVRELAKKY